MFSIAAINDTDSKQQWEPLAPTKEAQEFHLTQTYHEGLLKLQNKEYEKARELLEVVVKDPLVTKSQADAASGDSHLLQLRYLALKNLAAVFLEQGSAHHESALHCYLQAVEIDTKDSVVWNQLGTLACSMGLLSISRWAFEQGLICSPNNWNCMEKLLEVLIAIGDEVSCLSVSELILRHWPSHARALHVKRTIEESEPVPFAPRGIDKLEPKHVRLKFVDKRKASDTNLDDDRVSKKPNQTIELVVKDTSWTALADAILGIFPVRSDSKEKIDCKTSGDTRVAIYLPSRLENGENSNITSVESIINGESNNEDESITDRREVQDSEEQIHERRSSRLESLRRQKPEKEDTEFMAIKDVEKVIFRFLQPFVVSGEPNQDFEYSSSNSLNNEWQDVKDFVAHTSKNYGSYHLGHLLLEEVAKKGLSYRDSFTKFLELEKLTRLWVCDRTPECSLFLAELYHDIGSFSSNSSMMSEYMHEASYHLAKIIESVSLDCPMNFNVSWTTSSSPMGENSVGDSGTNCPKRLKSSSTASVLAEKSSFWVRFFWLSGLVSMWEGNRARAHEEFSFSMALLENNRNLNDRPGSIQLPHCRVNKELTTDKIRHQINILEVQFLLRNTIIDMLEKEMYEECIDLLAPLLLSTKGVQPGLFPAAGNDEGVTTSELSALDVLIKACEKVEPLKIEVYLNCLKRKLQVLMVAAGMEHYVASCDLFGEKLGPKVISSSGPESIENSGEHDLESIAEHVKAISECAYRVKSYINESKDSTGDTIPISCIGDIQTLLLALMCNIARICLCKKSSGLAGIDQAEQKQKCLFVNSAIAFCRLQHLDLTVTMKFQVDLIVAIHYLLAEYGLCCVGDDGGVDGTFLKLAIKHLLALNMKLKPSSHSYGKVSEESSPGARNIDDLVKTCDEPSTKSCPSMTTIADKSSVTEHGKNGESCGDHGADISEANNEGKPSKVVTVDGTELVEDEIEDLESAIDDALNQCFFCLYGLNLRSDSTYEDDLAVHRNTSQADYQSKEQCADVFKYILPYAKASTKTGLVKLRRVLRAIRKHFPQPPDDILVGNPIDKYLDDLNLCEDKLFEEAGSVGFPESLVKVIFPDVGILKQTASCEPYLEVYSNLYYLMALSEETSATDKWPGFVLTKEGEDFVEQSAKLSKYDLLFNPLRFESWQRLANIFDEEVDLLLNDGSKNINITGWRKNASLPQRAETSRRRSRRCLLMSLALAKTSEQQSEIHELLALVYYDELQNVVPFYDQRSILPEKDATWMTFCKNSKKHFEKAFATRKDWSHAFYLGKLCEKLECSPELSLSYYDKAISLNPSAADAFYRMHASRLKLLYTHPRKDAEILKIVASYSNSQTTKEMVMSILDKLANLDAQNREESHQLDSVWRLLYDDCLAALQICVEGDLKHFHKARYMLAQGLYKRNEAGDLEKAKDELSFCFKSARSSFTINMWEIDSTAKKGRRKTPAVGGSKRILEVNLPESSRKFITCIRKYLLFYLKLLEETRDVSTLDRAYLTIRADKRFSLCLEDLVPLALARYLKTLISSNLSSSAAPRSSPDQMLEKMFTLFMDQGSLWSDMCSLPEIKCSELTESKLYGYLHQYLYSLERDAKLDVLEGINEKIRKRSKNPKLSNSNIVGVHKHASVGWYRSLIIKLATITPLHASLSSQTDNDLDNTQLLCVDIQAKEFWTSLFGDVNTLTELETKWSPLLSKFNHVVIKKASDENLDTANSLLRSAYSFYRDSSAIMFSSGINFFWVPSRLVATGTFQPGSDGVESIEMSVPRKLLLWAYTLLHGRCLNISAVVKYCEENIKLKSKKASAMSSLVPSSTPTPSTAPPGTTPTPSTAPPAGGACKDGAQSQGGGEAGATSSTNVAAACNLAETNEVPGNGGNASSSENQRILSASQQLHHCNSNNTSSGERRSFDLNDDADPEKN